MSNVGAHILAVIFGSLAAAFCLMMLFCMANLGWLTGQEWYARRRQAKAHAAAVAAWKSRPRAEIVRIGYVAKQGNRLVARGFHLDGHGQVEMLQVGPNGETAFAGWTPEELVEIALRRAEFEYLELPR